MIHTRIALLVLLALLFEYRRRQRRTRRYWVRPFLQGNLTAATPSLFHDLVDDPELYYRYFRMTRDMFERLLDMVSSRITRQDTNYRRAIPAKTRLMVTLRYLAGGWSMSDCHVTLRLGKSTVSKIIRECCRAITEALVEHNFLKSPSTPEEWLAIAKQFEDTWNMPHCLGAIDGKHVLIQCPPGAGSANFSYKGHHSRQLMAICDANYKFLMVDFGQEGSMHDSTVFAQSQMGIGFLSSQHNIPEETTLPFSAIEMPYFLVGDEAFQLESWMMRPYGRGGNRELTEEMRVFNYRLSRARRTIENAFGILVQRWRILRSPIQASPETVEAIVPALICLHNMLMQKSSATSCPPGFADSVDASGNVQDGTWRTDDRPGASSLQPLDPNKTKNRATTVLEQREDLCMYLNNEAGGVPWQLDRVRRITAN